MKKRELALFQYKFDFCAHRASGRGEQKKNNKWGGGGDFIAQVAKNGQCVSSGTAFIFDRAPGGVFRREATSHKTHYVLYVAGLVDFQLRFATHSRVPLKCLTYIHTVYVLFSTQECLLYYYRVLFSRLIESPHRYILFADNCFFYVRKKKQNQDI